jgi:hypothetical protein
VKETTMKKAFLFLTVVIACPFSVQAQQSEPRGWLNNEPLQTPYGNFEFKNGYPAGDSGTRLREGRDAIILEKKEDMKRRGLASPDLADDLALTIAYRAQDHRWQLTGKPRHQYQYDPFKQAWFGRL